MLLLPPPLSPRCRMFVAARRRGLSCHEIARHLGITHWTVERAVQQYERFYGPVEYNLRRRTVGRILTFRVCCFCGSRYTVSSRAHAKLLFCSLRCGAKHKALDLQKISDSDVSAAIDMRHNEQPWRDVAKALGVCTQTIQKRIWYYLHERDLLTLRIVREIWQPSISLHRKSGRWGWLERTTGFYPKRYL